jgi:flagellar hook-associated protein 3 FlgL
MKGGPKIMRITNNMLVMNMMRNLNNNLRRLDKYQNQLSTGKLVQMPSDDPVRASRALKLRTDLNKLEQYDKNVTNALSWIEVTESAISNVEDVLQRARELTVRAANDSLSTEDKQKVADEMKQLKEHLISLGNTNYAGRYIFSGYKTDKKLFTEDGKFNIDITSSALANRPETTYEIGVGEDIEVSTNGIDVFGYEEIHPTLSKLPYGYDTGIAESTSSSAEEAVIKGDELLMDADIQSDTFENTEFLINYNGVNKRISIGTLSSATVNGFVTELQTKIDAEFGAGKISVTAEDNDMDGTDYAIKFSTVNSSNIKPVLSVDIVRAKESTLIKDFEEAINAMNTGDSEGIQEFLDDIDSHINRILSVRSDIGARVNRLELVQNRIDENNVTFTKLLSENEDADLAEVIMKLKNNENVYRASLSTGAKVIQPTLIDFIR